MLRLTYASLPPSPRVFSSLHTHSLSSHTHKPSLFPLSLPRLQAPSHAFTSMPHLRLPTTLFCQSYGLSLPRGKFRYTNIIWFLGKYQKCAVIQQKCQEILQVTVMKNKRQSEKKVTLIKRASKDQGRFMLTVAPSRREEPVNGELFAGCSLPLKVDTDEKQDQKATINNSFCSKTKPAGTLGVGGRWTLIHLSPLTVIAPPRPRPGSCGSNLMVYLPC